MGRMGILSEVGWRGTWFETWALQWGNKAGGEKKSLREWRKRSSKKKEEGDFPRNQSGIKVEIP